MLNHAWIILPLDDGFFKTGVGWTVMLDQCEKLASDCLGSSPSRCHIRIAILIKNPEFSKIHFNRSGSGTVKQPHPSPGSMLCEYLPVPMKGVFPHYQAVTHEKRNQISFL